MRSRIIAAGSQDDLKLTRAQLWEFTERLEVLYSARTFGSLMVSTVELMLPLFDADSYSVGFTDPARRRHLAIMRPVNPRFRAITDEYRELASQSPLLQYWLRTGDHNRILRRSDCCDVTKYRHSRLYSEIDSCNNCNHLLGTWLRPGGGRHLEVAMGRGGRTDFSEREIIRLAALRRHIYRAYVNVCDMHRFASLTGGLPAEDLPIDVMELQDTSLTADIDQPPPADVGLTPRECDVLHWIVEGKTNQEIGIILGISWRTVRLHCERIFRKLNVETRTAAAVRATELGISR